MNGLKTWSTIALLLACQPAFASILDAPLSQFFQQRLAGISDEVSVKVKTPDAQLPSCPLPDFSMPGNGRLWGTVSVLARCGNDKRFIQAEVQATGNYVVAAQALPRGSVMNESQVQLKRGRLDQLLRAPCWISARQTMRSHCAISLLASPLCCQWCASHGESKPDNGYRWLRQAKVLVSTVKAKHSTMRLLRRMLGCEWILVK